MATTKVVNDLFICYETNSGEIFIHHHVSVSHPHSVLRTVTQYLSVLAIAAVESEELVCILFRRLDCIKDLHSSLKIRLCNRQLTPRPLQLFLQLLVILPLHLTTRSAKLSEHFLCKSLCLCELIPRVSAIWVDA